MREVLITLALFFVLTPASADLRVLHRADHEDRLRAMWLAESLGTWTGLTTEGTYRDPPFLTDADWNTNAGSNGNFIGFVFQDPWRADDDTDIEYVYVHLMDQHGPRLTAEQIRDGWVAHINRFIWVSNDRARMLMEQGVLPPITGTTAANRFAPRIDAQLTTEMFGSVAPGMPAIALELSSLPIRNTAASYAAHAAQFHVALYAGAATTDRTLPLDEQIMQLVSDARALIPDTSKTADIIDYCVTDFLDNPDPNDWERTRDRVHTRYQQLLPDAHHGFPDPLSLGFRYRAWTESSVNLATGLIALLYGGGDLVRTIQIGTLSGWDSDNGTATMAGLVGYMIGYNGVTNLFPGETLSDRYDIFRTRDNLPDRLPDDPDAQDDFTSIAARMADISETVIVESGGTVRSDGAWLLPPSRPLVPASNPLDAIMKSSASRWMREQGGTVTATRSVNATPDGVYGLDAATLFAQATSTDFSGIEPEHGNNERRTYTSHNAGLSTGDPLTLALAFDRPVTIEAVFLIEDAVFPNGTATAEGGWFTDLTPEVRVGLPPNDTWMSPTDAGAGTVSVPVALDAATPSQVISFEFENTIEVTGLRVTGGVGGADAFVNVAELDGTVPPAPSPPLPFDLDGDGAITIGDLYQWHTAPSDVDGDGNIDDTDERCLQQRLRWTEQEDSLAR